MGSGRTFAVLGTFVVAAVAAGLWFVFGDDDADAHAPATGPGDVAAPADGGPSKPQPGAARRRAKTGGTAAVGGTVMFRDGSRPAAGRTVHVSRAGAEEWTAETDATGAFRIEGLPDGGPFEVRVEEKGCATVRIPGIGLARGEDRSVGTLWLDRAVRLPVLVRDNADRPIEGADVAAYASPQFGDDFDWSKMIVQMAQEPVALATARTDASGRAEFPALATGNWTIVATARGRSRGVEPNVDLRSDAEPPRVVLRLGTGVALTGRVLDEEMNPVAGATLRATRSRGFYDSVPAAQSRIRADAQGRFRFDDLDAGDVSIFAGRPGVLPVLRMKVRVPGVKEVDVVLATNGAIAGKVTDKETGKPVAGVTVRASQWGLSYHVAEATTDESGAYRIEDFPPGDVNDLTVDSDEWTRVAEDAVPGRSAGAVSAGGTAVADVVVQRGVQIAGTVRSGAGAAVAGARLHFHFTEPNRGEVASRRATTDTDGRYRIAGVPPGARGFVQAAKDGWYQPGFPDDWGPLYQDETSCPEVRVTAPATGEGTRDVTIERGVVVRGRVEGPGGPVAGAAVMCGGARSTSAADGTFTVNGVKPGPAVPVVASKPDLIQAEPLAAQVAPDGAPADVVVRMRAAPVVRGRVTTADGSPLGDARIVVGPGENTSQPIYWMAGDMAFEGAQPQPVAPDGTYRAVIAWAEGGFRVRVSDGVHATTTSATVQFEADRDEYVLDVVLAKAESLRGRVVCGEEGVGGAAVTLSKPPVAQNGMFFAMPVLGAGGATIRALTAADGTFVVDDAEPGDWTAEASARGYVTAKAGPVKVPGGAELRVAIERELTIEGIVVRADGKPVGGVQVQSEGAANQAWDGTQREPPAVTGADGRFRVRHLTAGSVTLRVDVEWNSRANVRATKAGPFDAGAKDVRIVVAEGGKISGRVTDAAGAPVAGAWINANGADSWRATMSGSDGRFELTSLDDVPYTLQVQSNGRGQPKSIEGVAVGRTDVEVVLDPAFTIEGIVVTDDGRPAPGVQLTSERIRAANEPSESIVFPGEARMSGADGRFRITGIGAGRYRITVAEWGFGSARPMRVKGGSVEADAGATDVRVVVVAPSAISGIVVDADGRPIAGASVTSESATGQRWFGGNGTTTDAAGRFSLAQFDDGEKVRIAATADGHAPARTEAIAAPATDVRVTLGRALRTTGRLVDAQGKPVAAAQLMFTRPGQRGSRAMTTTDSDGAFTNTTLGEGEWTVHALVSGRFVSAGTIAAGSQGVELRLAGE